MLQGGISGRPEPQLVPRQLVPIPPPWTFLDSGSTQVLFHYIYHTHRDAQETQANKETPGKNSCCKGAP